jgi:hypothetical protein
MTKDTLVMSSNWQSFHNNNSWLHTHYFTQCRVQVIIKCLSWRVPLLAYTTPVHYIQYINSKAYIDATEIVSNYSISFCIYYLYTVGEGVHLQCKRSASRDVYNFSIS